MPAQIIYYSLTGHTGRVCQDLAARLGCGADAIHAPFAGRGGLWSVLRVGWAVLTGRRGGISAPEVRASGDDLLVLGGQVWMGKLSSPLQSFLEGQPALPRRVALVLTSGDPACPDKVFAEFARLTGQPPVATLHVSAKDAKAGQFDDSLAAFCGMLTAEKIPA